MKTTEKQVEITYKDGDAEKKVTSSYSFEEMESLQECIQHAEKNAEEGMSGEQTVIHRYNYNTERYAQQNSRNKLVALVDVAKKVANITGNSVEDSLAMLNNIKEKK